MSLALIPALFCIQSALADNPHNLVTMTRNMDAGTDLNYLLAATDQASFVQGMAATIAEVRAAKIPERAALMAEEIALHKPDLIALQEVTLWRTGPILEPPATEILYDQLDLLLVELSKRKLHYGIVAIQTLLDAEAPVPTEGIDLRITDRDVILARLDLPQSQFEITNAQTHRFQTLLHVGSPVLGELIMPRGWMSVDVKVMQTRVRFVNTHIEAVYPSLPNGAQAQQAQVTELLDALTAPGMPLVLAGDFNANAEPGPEHTGAVEKIVAAGFLDSWRVANPGNPGYTWPLFGEDQLSGPTTPNERIDIIFTGRNGPSWFGRDPNVLSIERIGATEPWASDHAGVAMKLRVK